MILAAVSIATLTGQNGILTQASNAKEQTEISDAKEQAQLDIMAWQSDKIKDGADSTLSDSIIQGILTGKNYVESAGASSFITAKGGHEIPYSELYNVSEGGSLPTTADTSPFLPEGATVINDDLSTGVVIKDSSENEWVWIEVPKSIYTNTTYNGGTAPTSSEDYEKIESVMQEYASAYRYSWTDTWYSKAQHGFASADDYNNYKNNMLKSVYENGGFYIGRYEVGTQTARATKNDELTIPIIRQDAYPYNYVTCKQAQGLANQLATGGKTSSLMFGIQWDLVLKYIETKEGKTQDELKTDSKTWGNYYDAEFDIVRGKYSEDYGDTFTDVTSSYTKPNNTSVLLTTGATERNSTLNIYDLAGNVYEWTLEYTAWTDYPCRNRGGYYNYNGDDFPASYRAYYSTTYSIHYIGFRPALY